MEHTSPGTLLSVHKWLKATLLITAFLLIIFWVYFLLIEINDPAISSSYLEHELSFVIPDLLWIVGLLFLSVFWLRKNNLKGIVSATAAGGALVFLSILDISYNVQQGLYLAKVGDGILNVIINALSLGYGFTLLFVGYNLIKLVAYRSTENTNG